jgi:hypothetical protein
MFDEHKMVGLWVKLFKYKILPRTDQLTHDPGSWNVDKNCRVAGWNLPPI